MNLKKNKVIETMITLAERIKESGTWRVPVIGFSAQEYFESCEKFRSSSIKESLAQLASILDEDSDGNMDVSRKILKTAKISLDPFVVSNEFCLEIECCSRKCFVTRRDP